ncbi:nucleotide-binding protein [Bradyrhizobium sp. USDA 4350]
MGLPLLVIVGADKGGVGKTTVSRVLMDFFRAQGMDARAFDTQAPAGVLKRFHGAKTEVVDVTTLDGQMRVFDTLNSSAVTVLDLAAGLLTPILQMLRETGFVNMVAEGKANIAVLHVVGSSVASLEELKTITAAVAGLKLFVVSNPVSDAPAPKEAFRDLTVVELPKLNDQTFQAVDASSLPFSEFIADEGKSRVMRGYVTHWLANAFKALEVTRFNR